MKRFPNKRVFITGAASGLGRAIAIAFAKQGWKVAASDIHQDRLSQTCRLIKELGVETLNIPCDVTSYNALEEAASLLEKKWGGIDIVINNAGIADAGPMEDISLESWQRMLDIDLWSVIYGCKAFIPMLKRQGGGHIVNTASSAGIACAPEMANYNVAKAGVIALSETLKAELAGHNIGVTVVAPTVFKTNLGETLIDGHDTGMGRSLKKELEKSTVTADQITQQTLRAIRKNKLYVIPQKDAKRAWRMKRLFPESYFNLLALLYRKRLWIFSEMDKPVVTCDK
ncbi:MAG: SDR family oxidoreductase [Amphritea sp.]